MNGRRVWRHTGTPSSGRGHRARRLTTLVGAVLLAVAATAQAAPTVTMDTPGPVVNRIPVFTVSTAVPAATLHWELTGPAGYLQINEPPDPVLSVTTPVLPPGDDGLYTFTATETPATAPTVVTFTLDTIAPNAPTINSGPAAIVGPGPPITFGWTVDTAASSAHWQLLDFGTVILEGTTPNARATFSLPVLAPGDRILRLRVRLLDAVGNLSAFSDPYVFIVEQTPPGAPTGLTGPTGTIRNLSPTFSWQGTEAGGVYQWDVMDADGKGTLGPGVDRTTRSSSITVPSLPLAPNLRHNLVFTVREIDAYGNRSAISKFPFTITTVPIAVPPPKTRSANLMTPKAGTNLTSLRPLLRWRKIVPGTTLYNIQIYDGKRKVASFFPRGTKALVPKNKLKAGKRYVWYVFSYVAKKKAYSTRMMTSWFETKR